MSNLPISLLGKQLNNKYNDDTSVESLKWWLNASKQLVVFSLKQAGESVPSNGIIDNVEKSLTEFARHLLGAIELSPEAHKRVAWVSQAVSTVDIKEWIEASEIVVKQIKGSGCCGKPEPAPAPAGPY
jgi:hypothetical protein